MMRLWVQSYERQESVAPVVTLSAAAHALIIGAWVLATLPAKNDASDTISSRVVYIPPPDRVPAAAVSHETVHYVTIAQAGLGTGEGPRKIGNDLPVTPDETVGHETRDSLPTPPPPPPVLTEDSVFSVLDVDTAVVRLASSAAPAYPLKLLEAHIMGSVFARYVVDTTGFADTTSFTVVNSTNPEFVSSVRAALPYMRFQPAKIGTLKVRQLVEQNFSFKIADTTTAKAPGAKKP